MPEELYALHLEGAAEDLEAAMALLGDRMAGAVDNSHTGSMDIYLVINQVETVKKYLANQGGELPWSNLRTWSWSEVPPEAWQMDWKATFTPVRVTDGIAVVAEWDSSPPAKVNIRILPSMAFGTGHHATTRLEILKMHELGCDGKRVLDLGTGSGVLTIAAAKLGASSVRAVEYDETCRENFEHNLALNNLAGVTKFHLFDALQWTDFDYDMVVANIQRKIIFPVLENFAGSKSDAHFLASGILAEEEIMLRDHSAGLGLEIIDVAREEEWICAVLRRV